MMRNHPKSLWCRYADDGICHCKTEAEAQALLVELKQRFAECKLEIHPEKTKIVYCKDGIRRKAYEGNTSFVFLGYEFRARRAENKKTKKVFTGFLPAISPKAEKSILEKARSLNIRNRSDLALPQIAKWINPMLRGWINYYGKYTRSALNEVLQRINGTLVMWSMRKYEKIQHKKTRAIKYMEEYASKHSYLFAHWKIGVMDVFI